MRKVRGLRVLSPVNRSYNEAPPHSAAQFILRAEATTTTLLLIVFIGEAVREAFDPKEFSRLR